MSVRSHSTATLSTQDEDETKRGEETPVAKTSPSSFNEKASIIDEEASVPEEVVDEVNYQTLTMLGAAVLFTKAQLGLGILALPQCFKALGLIPGIAVLLFVAVLTTWASYVMGRFKLNHMQAMSMADVGEILAGPIGRETVGAAYCIILTASAAATMLGVSIALDTISGHHTCSLIFVAVALVISLGFASIQTLGKISSLGWIGCASIMISVLTLTIAVGVNGRPTNAPEFGAWDKDIHLFTTPDFATAITAVSHILFAYGSIPVLLAICSEMKSPAKDFQRTIMISQGFVTFVYILIGVAVYMLAGQYVSSPALGSAGVLMKKVCYGLALPGLLVTCIILIHVSGKYVFVRALRTSSHLTRNTPTHYFAWGSSVLGCGIFSFLLAAAIPFFGPIIALIGSSVGAFLCFMVPGAMWLFDHPSSQPKQTSSEAPAADEHKITTETSKRRSIQFRFLRLSNLILVLLGAFMVVAGSYGAVKEIMSAVNEGESSKPFSCADHSAI